MINWCWGIRQLEVVTLFLSVDISAPTPRADFTLESGAVVADRTRPAYVASDWPEPGIEPAPHQAEHETRGRVPIGLAVRPSGFCGGGERHAEPRGELAISAVSAAVATATRYRVRQDISVYSFL